MRKPYLNRVERQKLLRRGGIGLHRSRVITLVLLILWGIVIFFTGSFYLALETEEPPPPNLHISHGVDASKPPVRPLLSRFSSHAVTLENPAAGWLHGFPCGNGRLGGMLHGSGNRMVVTVNDELLYGGGFVHEWKRVEKADPMLYGKFKQARRYLMQGNYAMAQTGRSAWSYME